MLQNFDGIAERAGLVKGTPEYQQAARVWANLDPKAKAQIVENADGFNVATYGGGNNPTSAPVMSGGAAQVPQRGGMQLTDLEPMITGFGGKVSSTFRTPAHNAEVGGKPNSQHLTGNAMDVVFPNVNAKRMAIDAARKNGYQAIEEGNHVHFQLARGGQQGGTQLRPAEKANAGSFQQLSAQEVQSLGLPTGTVAQRGPNGQVSVINKPEPIKRKEISAEVIKSAANLPALARRLQRLSEASDAINGMFDGGPMDKYAIGLTPQVSELESAAAQVRPLLTALTRVPGVGSQSDLEARLDGLQYPDVSQPPATRKKNIAELQQFVKDLSDAYKSIATMGNGAPASPNDDQALLDKYLK